jgi:16S rRNA (adenine(1408)-N(1))-methyltransferase
MRVVLGKNVAEAAPAQLEQIRANAGQALIDVGAGDARTAYRYARAHPDRLVIGLDPAAARMAETAGKAARKPAKGGAGNLILVNASIEDAPPELRGLAGDVWVLMPWGKLLRGVALGEADVCGALAAIAAPGARLEVRIGVSIWRDPVPLEVRDLPEVTPEYVETVLAPRLADTGWRVADASYLDPDAPPSASRSDPASSWARRLSSDGNERIIRIIATLG